MNLFLVLLVCPITAWIGTRDQIYFHTSFSCQYTSKPSYYYSIRFEESDHYLPDSFISDWGKYEYLPAGGSKTRKIYNATVENGDYGWEYEFGMKIKHNCVLEDTYYYSRALFTHEFCKIGKGDCHVYISMDLTGLMDWTSVRQVWIKQNVYDIVDFVN